MAATAELSGPARDELLVTYAALILHDDKADITADSLNSLIKASGTSVEGYWPVLFARMLQGKDISEYIATAGTPGGGGVGGATAAAAAASTDYAVEAAPKKEEPEEEEEDMDFDLFG